MTALHFQHPMFLLLPLLAIPLLAALAWRSRAETSRRSRAWSLAVRCAWAAVCAAAASGPWLGRSTEEPTPVSILFVEDASRSVADVSDQTRATEQAVRDAMTRGTAPGGNAGDAGRSGGISFGTLLFASTTWQPGEAPPGLSPLDETNIAGALDDANRRTLQSAQTHVILLSDGRATRGDSAGAAGRIAMRGARVHVMPIGRRRDDQGSGARIVRVDPGIDCHVGVPNVVKVTLNSEQSTRATVRLLDASGKLMDQRDLPLLGSQTAALHFTPREGGLRQYQVVLSVPSGVSGSEVLTAGADGRDMPIYVHSPPRILIADDFPEEMTALKAALAPLQVPVDVISPDDWPEKLAPYAAVIASDWSGRELTDAQRAELRHYVEERGGGLVFIGGGNVLPARWKANPLAEALPVVLREKPKELVRKKPQASVVYVVDRSGSMSEALPSSSGTPVSKIDLVKAAIIASVQTLPENSQVGVVAFDHQPDVLVPATPVTQKDDIIREVDKLQARGGTRIEPGIRLGMDLLAHMPGDKYLVVLTDGIGERPADTAFWGAVADDAKKAHYSWTSIAVGTDADQTLLSFLAKEARGKFFYCDTADKLPKVFMDQAKSIKRISEQPEKPFKPMPGPSAGWLKDVSPAEMPELTGRVHATAKEHVDSVLLGEGTESLLAFWQFGLGKVVAFTSDAKALWAGQWVPWKGYSAFWLQVVQSVMRVNPDLHARVRSRREGNHITFNFVVTDQQGRPALDLHAAGTLADAAPTTAPVAATAKPAGDGGNVSFDQVGLGDYQASVDVPADGKSHLISMSLGKEDGAAEDPIRYFVDATGEQNAEMSQTGPDLAALQSIADAGHGVCSTDPDDIAAACRELRQTRTDFKSTPLWPGLLLAALLLWPIDLAVRKFA
jgi:Ca-activated chloride channel family protein